METNLNSIRNINGELGVTKLELFIQLKQAIISNWKLQNFDQNTFTRVEEYQGFVDYFRY